MPNWLRDFPQDFQYAARLLRKSPGFAATAVLTLALGIGANTTLFSVVNGVLLNPLPYPRSGQLVAVYGKTPGFDQGPAVYLNFLDWQRDNRTFSSIAMYRNQDYNVTGTAEAERLSGYMISAGFFSTLGVQPILGRAFRSDDDQVGAAPAVILGWRVNPGFNPSHAITFNLSMPSSSATASAETRARLRRFDDKMSSIPGVLAVSVTLGSRPMIHDSSLPFWIEGQPKPANDNEMHQAMFYLVEAGFEQAMRITLERGRFVTPQDNENAPVVIDIDDVFARAWFPRENPIGKRVHLEQFNVQAEIVGVVGHIKQWGLGTDQKTAVEAQFYYPFMQLPEKLMGLAADGVAVVLRTTGDPAAVMGLVRRAVEQIDRRDVIYGVQTMDEVLAGSFAARRLSMILLGIFAALALILSCVGIYGVISYVVGQRTHEIGVRMALGAQPRDVMRLVLAEGAKMALVGVAAGIAAALGLTRLMANELFGVTAQDPLTFAAVAILLTLVALLACYLPARRAVRVDPMVALRYE